MRIADVVPPLPFRIKPLVVCLAIACTVGAPASSPSAHPATTTLPVTNCEDDGSNGSLRRVVEDASDGDTVDLSALTCSTISLQSGAIVISVDNLTLTGPGTSLTIDGNYNDSLFEHTGTGTLTIDSLRLYRGFKYQNGNENALGGCIFSAGNVSLGGTEVIKCTAERGGAETGYGAKGGAIYATGDVSLMSSTVTSSVAEAGDPMNISPGFAYGGGIYAGGQLSLIDSVLSYNMAYETSQFDAAAFGGARALNGFEAKYSTIDANKAVTQNVIGSTCGGVCALTFGEVQVLGSTISRNSAAFIGGFYFRGTGTSTITNSTISSNYAYGGYGGLAANGPVKISNSTIAFNQAPGNRGGGGLMLFNGVALELESTIIAGNTSGGTYAADLDATTAVTVTGADNLVQSPGTNVTLPTGTLNADPLLGPLQDNGGATLTHALLPGSPAIDTGNNLAGRDTDQRGPTFPRVVGAAADIGAFETNPEMIFANGFN